MLRIYKYPEHFSRGLEDRFSDKIERSLNSCGIPCQVRTLWPDSLTRLILNVRSSYSDRFFFSVLAPMFSRLHLRTIRPADIVWITGPSMPNDTLCTMEKAIKRKGASYVFWLEDDYFSVDILEPVAMPRMKLADLVIAVTPNLENRIRTLFPNSRVLTLEEPIDTDRLQPRSIPVARQRPLVVWGGRVWNLKKLLPLNSVLKRVYREFPFDLRIITDTRKPELALSIPWEWRPYDRSKEAEYNAGAAAGLAPLEDVTYNQCKGNYKIKTYMAMGVPPLTSPVGYNLHLIRHGETGFLLNSEEEWESTLRLLLRNPSLGAKVGAAARLETVKRYSYQGLMPVWAEALSREFPGQFPVKHDTIGVPLAPANASVNRNQV